MLSEEVIDKVVERLVNRIEQANTYFLMEIGKSISKLRGLKPSDAHRLAQIFKYGDNYNEIVKKLAKYMNANVQDIDEILSNFAKKDLDFNEKFYKYRNIPLPPFEQNKALNDQIKAFREVIKSDLYNFTRPNVLGYTLRDINNRVQFYGLKDTYNRVIDEAILNLTQGKENFDMSMSRILTELGGSGLKKIDYSSGRTMRLDSAVRMHVLDGMRNLHNANQELFGEQFDADGVEITVHENPAPDHVKVQGRQFRKDQYIILQRGQEATDYKGNKYTLDQDHNGNYRPISDLNCYHYVYSIVLGVSEPQYTDEQLKKIERQSKEKIEIDGKEYTKYECTQLLRKIELELRKSKDIQILARSSNNAQLVGKMQYRITKLTNKYRDILKISGLKSKLERAKVAGYKRINIKNMKQLN